MFEKEAEEYATNWKIHKNANLNYAEVVELRAVIYKAHKDGAEFGYNKSNEWHFVKDGDLPRGLPKPVLIAFHNKFSDKIVIDIARYSLELNKWWFIHDLKDLEEDVIAWKEIVLPEREEVF